MTVVLAAVGLAVLAAVGGFLVWGLLLNGAVSRAILLGLGY